MRKSRAEDVPADIYARFVRSLYNDSGTVLVGAVCHSLIGFLVYSFNGHPVYLALAVLMFGGGLFRYLYLRSFDPGTSLSDPASTRLWERRFLVGACVQGFFLGLFCFVSLLLVPDPFAEVASVSVAMGSTVAIVGRNYGSRVMVAALTTAVVMPIAVGLMLKGSLNYFALGLFIVPFWFVITKMADHVRTVLFAAIIAEKKSARLAARFDRALNTMSHGLVMLSNEGKVVVANAEAAKALQLASPEAVMGRTLKALLLRAVAGGVLSINDCRFVESQLTRALRDRRDRKLLVSFSNGRHYEFSAREGSDELGVITFEDVTSRIEAEEKVRYMARYDRLTGLPNRGYFYEIVSEAMAAGPRDRKCALAVFDLDDFKSINDTLGHPVGDGLIFAVGERLSAFATSDVKVSRFGGDEFMIYFDRIEDESHLGSVLDAIFSDMEGEVDVAGHALRFQLSAGAVLSTVNDTEFDSMIVKADLALYKAKEQGKNGWRLFESAMDAAFRNRQIMKTELRNSIAARGLRVVYQPIIAMGTMQIASCEALCRWDHPELGPISPAVFIPLAEEMGIVSEISTFVLEAACAECVGWPEQISVSVNLSAKDFRNRSVIAKIKRVLEETGLAPHRLEIEVTETALLDDKSSTAEVLGEIKALGVRIALDDFGTGYCSLSYLHTLPLDKVKIDRSFITDLAHDARSLELLKGIVNLSRPLGLSVTIEGVETFEQLRVLDNEVGPDLVQGFLFGAALSGTGIRTMSSTIWPFARDLKPVRLAKG